MSKIGKILFLVSGISALILFVTRLILQGWHDMLWAPLGITGVAFVAALIVDFKFYLEFLTMRTTKHGMNMGVMILLGVVLTVAVNFLGSRFNQTFDLTKEKINSLSDQSQQVLKDLKSDVTFRVFSKGKNDQELRVGLKQMLQKYTDASTKVKINFVDSYAEPAMAKKYLNEGDRFALVTEYEGRMIKVEEPFDEEKITSSIIRTTRTESRTIAFIIGHQERDLDSQEVAGMKDFAESLRQDSYTVSKINLMAGGELPDPQTGIVAIVGPKSPYFDGELEKIRAFARAGGRLFIAIDPGENHQLANLTKTFGVEFKNNYVASETTLQGLSPVHVLGLKYDATSEITKKFGENTFSIFPMVSEVVRAPDASSDLQFSEIVKSHNSAFDVANLGVKVKDPSRREHTLAISVRGKLAGEGGDDKKRQFSAVIFGDSDFVANNVMAAGGVNKDLALNAIAYLADESGLISIRPKKLDETPLKLTETNNIIIMAGGVGFPLLLIILSGILWYRRRNL